MLRETTLRYKQPAENFCEALPLGNGRIGAMIFGDAAFERVRLNEDSVWSGSLRNRVNPDALEGLAEVRELIMQGNIPQAEKTAFEKMQGVTPNMRHYMPLGDLHIDMELNGRARNYSRILDISNAIAAVSFTVNDILYKKEYFISAPDEVMVIRISAEKQGMVSLSCCLDGRDDYYDNNRPCGKNMLLYDGGTGSRDGIFFAAVLGAEAKGGSLRTVGGKITVQNADEVMLVLSARTSFYVEDHCKAAVHDAEMALECTFGELFERHTADYKALFDRVDFSLNENSGENLEKLDTAGRLQRLKGDEMDNRECTRLIHDNKLIELYFNFGRYLMISASRKGTQPMHIQGIWNDEMNPKFGSRYAVNINTEMNYWPAESCNLAECHLPLFDLLERICINGHVTAKEMYGISKGFVCHHMTDIWGDTAPQDTWIPATIWQTGGAWLALHVFEHYEYTLDRDFLAEKYHIMKQAAEFFTEFLIADESGYLVTCPSVSPENTYRMPDGTQGCLCKAPSMDSQIITVLFRDVIKSAEILGIDEEFCEKLRIMLEKIPQPDIGKYGQIKEWLVDYDEPEIGHFHVSQLFALHPADMILPFRTPKLADAARATLVRRLIHGGGNTGWSCAWVTNMWARLGDSRMVYENLKKLLANSTSPNMFDSHTTFQIDGNFGGVSAITEALLQSVGGEILILPALPDEWDNGHIHGLRAKGGFGVNIDWCGGRLKKAEIISDFGGECRIRTNCVVSVVCGGNTVNSRIEDGAVVFDTQKGMTYTVTA